MAADTVTLYRQPPFVSITATVATISGLAKDHRHLVGPAAAGGNAVQAAYILQSSGVYRWVGNETVSTAPTDHTYRPLADDPIYSA